MRLIRSDVRARVLYEGQEPGTLTALFALLNPGNIVLAIWRFQVYFNRKRIPLVNKFLALANMVLFCAELEPEAEVGEGFLLVSPVGIMLHGHSRIGRNCLLAGQVTTSLGPRAGFDPVNDYIDMGDDVTISSGVRIIGNLSIGSNTWVGPNTVVTDSLPSDSIVQGKTVKRRDSGEEHQGDA